MCTPKIIRSLDEFTDTLCEFEITKNSTALEVLELIVSDISQTIEDELADCLHTDQTLKDLLGLFRNSLKVAHSIHREQTYDKLRELTINLLIVRDELEENT